MKLNPRHVRFISPFLNMGLPGGAPRFVGKEKNVQLRETAFVVEGSVVKVSFLGLEVFFQRAITENTSLTIPYQRMRLAKLERWPLARMISLILIFVIPCVGFLIYLATSNSLNSGMNGLQTFVFVICFFGTFLSIYAVARIRHVYRIVYQDKSNQRRKLLFRIRSKPVQDQFDQQLQQYLTAARQYSWSPQVVKGQT